MRSIPAALLICSIGAPLGARAQTDTAQTDATTIPAPSPSSPLGTSGSQQAPDDIVVTAERYGEAKVPAETEFSEDEIASQGVDSIQDLLSRLSPFIDPNGNAPVILINGRPAGFDRSVLSYPAEALTRLTVLKPEAASQYSAAPGQRVVNLILKRHFASLDADAGGNLATGGGQSGGNLALSRTAISGDTRWNVRVDVGRDSGLRKDARDIPPRDGDFDSMGYVVGADGGEIDPALSAASGSPVITAAIPLTAANGTATLADFVATAGKTHPVDPNAFETLQSSRRTMSLNAGVTRPVGAFTVSLNINAASNGNNGLRGLPMASVSLPGNSPWSPFAGDVVVTRPFAGDRALRNDNSSKSFGGSLTVTGSVDGWQGSLALGVTQNWNDSLLETGIDTARVQQLIGAGDPDFNPFGVWANSLLLAARTHSRARDISARLSLQKNVLDLPAGPVGLTLTANANRNDTNTRQSDGAGAVTASSDMTRQQISGQLALNLPFSRRGMAGIGPIGDLSADLSLGVQSVTGSPAQKRYTGGLSWSPFPALQLRGTMDYVEMAPSIDQRDGPVLTSINRIFDYAQQQIAEPVWITGGNPNLGRGKRQGLSLTALLRPLGNETLSLNVGYRQNVAKGIASPLPELTPAIEAAFPERITRDVAGQLISVDARPINIARNTSSDFTSSLALRFPRAGNRGAAAQKKEVADPIQFNLSLNYRLRLKSEMLIRAGLPIIDQLAAAGESRHSIGLQLGAGKRGMGANLNATWSSRAQIGDLTGDPTQAFHIAPPVIFNLSAFVDPGRLLARLRDKPFAKGWRVSLDIQNLFNGYRHVTLGDGTVPTGFSHDEIDPLGRTMRLTVRKRF